ncbi:MAG: hypothetical protein Q9159_006930 [Coniocarpon cinnabarinum]
MSRRAAAAPKNYSVDQEASSDSELEAKPAQAVRASKTKPSATRTRAAPSKQAAGAGANKPRTEKTRRKSDSKPAVVKEIPATQVPDESADEFDLPGANERALSTPMTATKKREEPAVPAKAASEGASKPHAKHGRKAKDIKNEIPDTQVEDFEGEAQASSNLGRSAQAPKRPRPAKREAKVKSPVADIAHDDDKTNEEANRQQKQDITGPRATGRKRSNSESEGDGSGSDRSAKRRLSAMTKRFESLEVQYEQLKNVAVKEAETNYDELKERTNEQQKAADSLVSHLRTELASQASAAAEAKDLQSRVSDLQALTEKLKKDNESLQTNLTSAQADMKALQVKLAATRAASEQRAVPNSAVKKGVNGKQALAAGSADTQKLAIKEQLYGDLTGLIIRDVKRREDEDGNMDVYDCIQTGRNGTLRFHLAVPNPQPPGVAYGDADLEYSPLLDPSNDRTLIEILPDYLTDEILFPQKEAQRFYGRINEFIMKSRPSPAQIPDDVTHDDAAEEDDDTI